jgi:hypothetical protein
MSLKSDALRYLREGWSLVPVKPEGKSPLIPWTKYRHEPPTKKQVEAWWEEWPDANIGLVTGKVSGRVVVDIDPDRGSTLEEVLKLAHTDCIQETGGGGHHCVYEWPGHEVQNRANVLPGVDVRGDGGIFVADPSVHASGKKYRWVNRKGKPGKFPAFAEGKKAQPDSSRDAKWIAKSLSGVPRGERNDTATKLAGYFAGLGVPQDILFAVLESWNARNKAPLPRRELRRTVDSIAARATPKEVVLDTEGLTPLSFVPWRDFVREFGFMAHQGWLVEEWIPLTSVSFVTAPPGSFKTWFLYDLAVSIASGLPFLGHFSVFDPGPVLVVQQEDDKRDISRRVALIMKSRHDIPDIRSLEDVGNYQMPGLPSVPLHILKHREFSFEDETAVARLKLAIEQFLPRVVLIDPLYMVVSPEDYMMQAVKKMAVMKDFRDEYKVSFVLAHHTRKSAGTTVRGEMWGSQFLNAFSETNWHIRETEERGRVEVHRTFKTTENPAPTDVTFDIDRKGLEWYRVAVTTAKDDPQANEVLVALQNKEMKQSEVAKVLGWHHQQTKRVLERLEARGLVIKVEGKYCVAIGPGNQMDLTDI